MNIVRNIYCEGVFEGTYQLVRCCYEGYIWMIVETDILPRLKHRGS